MFTNHFIATASLALLACCSLSQAQESNAEDADNDAIVPEAITVIGTRADLASALNDKRASETISDFISSEEIGSLPDLNIGDSLQRVPGVQVQPDARGQTSSITIRGLPSRFTQIVYSGRPVLAPFGDSLGGRNFSAFIVPSSFVRKLGVAKTSRADVVEGGIAGTIDIVSRTAFSTRKNQNVSFDLRGAHESNSGDISQNFSAMYSDIFADGTLGFLVGANYVKELPETHRVRGGDYNIFQNERRGRDLNGDGDTIDEDIILRRNTVAELFDSERERVALISNLDYRPNHEWRFLADVLIAEQETNNAVAALQIDQRRNENTNSALQETILVNGFEIVSQLSTLGSRIDARGELQERKNELLVGQLAANWTPGLWDISLKAGVSSSDHVQERHRAQARGPDVPITANFNSDDQPVAFTIDDDVLAQLRDTNNYRLQSLTSAGSGTDIANSVETRDVYLDVTRDLDWGYIRNFKTGFSYTDNQFDSTRARFNLNAREIRNLGVSEFQVIAFEPGDGNYLDAADVFVPVPVGVDILSLVDTFSALGIGTDELITGDNSGVSATDNAAELIKIDEKHSVLYFMFDFGDGNDIWSGNLGLRYIHTDETRGGATIDLNSGFIREEDDTLRAVSEGTPTSLARTYSKVLPSFNLRYNLSENQIIRLGAAQTFRRPDPANLDLVVTGLSGSDDDNPNRLRVDDPNIEPFLSNNLDISWSWYFNEESLFSFAYFYKDLDSLVETQDILLEFDVTDEATGITNLEPFEVRTTTNERGVTLKGFEVQYQQPFTFLPGFLQNFGAQANYTFIDNSAPDRLQAAAEDNYNLILYYDDGRIDARLSYTFRGEYLGELGNEPNPNEIYGEREFLAGLISYQINDNFEVFLNGANLTNAAQNRFRQGPLARQYQDFGRSISLGLRGNF